MALLDRIVGEIVPPESESARAKAREKALAFAKPDDWLGLILEHHDRIEAAFAAVVAASPGPSRQTALESLALMLTAHSNAEESVIYPALARAGHDVHALEGYKEQAQAKIKMADLERQDPTLQAFLDALDQIRGAVAHHMYEEENGRLLDVKQLPAAEQQEITRRYRQEFDRYFRSDSPEQGLTPADSTVAH